MRGWLECEAARCPNRLVVYAPAELVPGWPASQIGQLTAARLEVSPQADLVPRGYSHARL